MLKKLYLNKKAIPVPVPLRNVAEALQWIEDTFCKPDESITKMVLDSKDLLSPDINSSKFKLLLLDEDSRLEIQLDSPLDLAVQSLDAIRNLTLVVERNLKPLAVHCWQTPPTQYPQDLSILNADLKMILDLSSHATDLIGAELDYSVFRYLNEKLVQNCHELDEKASVAEWQGLAKVLLNRLEPRLAEITAEAENLQTQIFSRISEKVMGNVGSSRI